jgi:hypothetical protein
VGQPGISEMLAPGPGRWGVYQVGFTKLVHNRRELVELLQANLSQLQQIYQRWKASQTGMQG